jgi:hypothetical protein
MLRLLPRAKSALIASVSLMAVLGLAQPAAAAKGGGNTQPPVTAPAPATLSAPAYLDCFGDFGDPTIPNMTAPDVAVNYAGTAGCVGVLVANGTLRLAWVVLADGWTYVVNSNGGGTNSRVQLQFTHITTGQSISFRFEFGKTTVG